jgi:flagellar export protein FliJ
MPRTLKTLEKMVQLRARSVSELSSKFSQQQQLCQRYDKNIQALQALALPAAGSGTQHAALMRNQAQYKKNLQRIIAWQDQEKALATLKMQEIQRDLLQEARRENGFQTVLDKRKEAHALEQQRRDQKTTDAISAQSWIRQRQRG